MKIRTENYTLNVFFKDKAIIKLLTDEFPKMVTEISQPKNEEVLNYLQSNILTEIKKELPYGCRYKVYLGYSKKTSQTSRENFISMSKRIPDDVRATEVVLNKLDRDRPWYSQYYIFVKDSKHLMMVQLLLQDNIKKIIEIKTADEITKEEKIDE
jgi:hypothetical protein